MHLRTVSRTCSWKVSLSPLSVVELSTHAHAHSPSFSHTNTLLKCSPVNRGSWSIAPTIPSPSPPPPVDVQLNTKVSMKPSWAHKTYFAAFACDDTVVNTRWLVTFFIQNKNVITNLTTPPATTTTTTTKKNHASSYHKLYTVCSPIPSWSTRGEKEVMRSSCNDAVKLYLSSLDVNAYVRFVWLPFMLRWRQWLPLCCLRSIRLWRCLLQLDMLICMVVCLLVRSWGVSVNKYIGRKYSL